MGRNKFEDQFKEKLAQRELTPSAGSWKKLSGQLHSEERKKDYTFWWIGIAATILGVIFIAGLVYNSDTEAKAPGIVEFPVKEFPKEVRSDIIKEQRVIEINVIANEANQEENSILPENENSEVIKNLDEQVILASRNDQETLYENEDFDEMENLELSQKLEEVIAEVSLKDSNKDGLDMDEIDALLYKAASEISLERRNDSTFETVDAGELLFAVEMELEESFREKVFDILKEGYLKAKTAVANRNY